MSANFTPIFGGYREPGAFRFWCQKVLPLVYDDSLSYYELLCKVVDYINNLVHDNSATIDNVNALLTAYNQLQDYVNNYFANLDITSEISDKIDQMADDGTLLEILEPVTTDLTNYIREQAEEQQLYNQQTRFDVEQNLILQNEYNATTRSTMNSALAEQNEYNASTRSTVTSAIDAQTAYNTRTREIAEAMVGHPFTANSSAAMTDQSKVYVYTGTTSGNYVNGHWYYYNGGWIDGGIYNSQGLTTDKGLTLEDNAGDARYTGLRLNDITSPFTWRTDIRHSTSNGAESSSVGWYSTTKFTVVDITKIVGVSRICVATVSSVSHITGYIHLYEAGTDTYIGFCFYTNGTLYFQSANQDYSTLPSGKVDAYIDVSSTEWYAVFADSWTNAIRMVKVQTDSYLNTMGVPADAKAVGDEISGLKGDLTNAVEIRYTDILSAHEYIQVYVNASGSITGSTSWRSYIVGTTESAGYYERDAFCYKFKGYTNTVGFYAIAFYDYENFSTATANDHFIGGVKYTKTTGEEFTLYKSDIPANAKLILFLTRTASATDQTLYKGESGYKAQLNQNTEVIRNHWGTPTAETVAMVVGGIVGTSGADDPRSDRMRSDYLEVSNYSGTVTMPTGVNCIVHGYDSNMNWISAYPSTSWQSSFTWEAFPNTFVYIRFVVNTGSLSENITIYRSIYTNQELTDAIIEADSTSEELAFVYSIGSKNQIARLGWKPYASNTPPEQSNASYALAYKNGCKIMLCDVRVTSDGKYVLWHDTTLNNTVKHADGTDLSEGELATTIESSTLAELNIYDYGVYKGSEYSGMKIPMLKDFLEWCGLHNIIPMLEIKVLLTTAQCVEIAKLCKMYGLGERVIIDEYTTNINSTVSTWIANLPKATISIIGGSAIDLVIPKAQNIINEGLNALVVLSSSAQLSAIQDSQGNIDYAKVQSVTNIGADFVYTEIQSANELQSFYEDGYLSVFKYVASSYVDIDKWVQNNVL